MIALDTNVVVRFVVNDDHEQAQRARRLVAAAPVLLTTTVVLETEWVLRTVYGIDRSEVHKSLIAFCGLANVTLSEPSLVMGGLKLFGLGLDLADALHLVGSDRAERFASFDRDLRRIAGRLKETIAVVEP